MLWWSNDTSGEWRNTFANTCLVDCFYSKTPLKCDHTSLSYIFHYFYHTLFHFSKICLFISIRLSFLTPFVPLSLLFSHSSYPIICIEQYLFYSKILTMQLFIRFVSSRLIVIVVPLFNVKTFQIEIVKYIYSFECDM